MGLPPLRTERARLPILPILVVLVPIATTIAGLKYLHVRNLQPVGAEITLLKKSLGGTQTEAQRLSNEVDHLTREVAALQAIARVEIVWGGASEDSGRIAFYYQHAQGSSAWTHPKEGQVTVWYYTDEGDTLARIAAHPRVLGAFHLWPILAKENGMHVSGTDPLPAGRLVRVPVRIYESQIRQSITEAGTPDKQRNEIFAQAGLKP